MSHFSLPVPTGVLVWVVLRERIKRIEQNPPSRLIYFVYEPVLRWILRHKLLFLTIPTTLVIWGLSIWLGWGVILSPLVAVLGMLGLAIDQWSMAWWVHLGIGLVLGLWLLPLIVDSIRVARLRRTDLPIARHGRRTRLAYLVIGLGLAAGLHGIGLAQAHARAASAIFVAPPGDEQAQQPQSLSEFKPLASWLDGQTGIGQEFMPPLDEGDFLYMPSVLPAGSINTVMEVMRKQDMQFAQIPEADVVVGKLGRIESALDPAPVGMLETLIGLKPRDEWPLIEDPEHPGRMRRRTNDEVWEEIKSAGRCPVRIRYQRELRDDLPDLRRILVPTPDGAQILISQLADIRSVVGPMSVRREGAKYVSYVTMSNVGVDETTLVHRGQAIIDQAIIDGTLDVPEGYSFKWAGSYERNVRAKKRLTLLVPLVLLINFVLIYLQFKRFPLTVVVFLAIPVFGGMVFALITLFVVPACYAGLKQLKWRWRLAAPDFAYPAAFGNNATALAGETA